MNIVDTSQRRRLAKIVEQVAEIVQQCGGYQLVVGSVTLGKIRRLQRMLQLRHGLAAVLLVPVFGEQAFNVGERQHVDGFARPTAASKS